MYFGVEAFIVLFVIAIKQINGSIPETYTAAVVEYNAIEFPLNDNVRQNEQNHEKIMEDAKKRGADLVVFPELSLLSLYNEFEFTVVPDPSAKIAPCDENMTTEAVRKLSCASRRYKIYSVINIAEKVDCQESHIPECKDDPEIHFNTNIVFDRNGAIVARHRKYHLFAEVHTIPNEPEPTYFDTDFGVRFGVITCFEILFEYPGRTLVEDLGIKNIIVVTAWSSSLPYHIGSQVTFGWAYRYNVNLLVAGLNSPKTGSTGTSIFRGKYEIIANYIGDDVTSKMLIGKLYKNVEGPNLPKATVIEENFAKQNSSEIKKYLNSLQAVQKNVGKLLSKLTGSRKNKFQLAVIGSLEDGSHELIQNKIFDKVVCHRQLCCHFDVSLDHLNNKAYHRAYVFDGVADFQGMTTGGTQSCLIIFCADKTLNSCVTRSANGEKFNSLTISGNFRRNHTLQTPTAVRHEGPLSLMDPKQFKHTVNCHDDTCRNVITINQPTTQLIVFGIYGRDFTKDGLPPDDLVTDVKSKRIY